jgi:type I restriction enzyme M protein
MAKGNHQKPTNDSGLNFEAQLWAAAEQAVPASHLTMTEYNGARPEGLCLGLIFLKYISDTFEEKREQLLFGFSDPKSEWFIKDEPERKEAGENRDEYLAANVFWLPPEVRWHTIKAKAKSPEIGKVIDDAMGAIEREIDVAQASSPAGSGGVPAASRNTRRGRPANPQPGTAALHSKDVLGRGYEYGKFASAEGTLRSAKLNWSNRRKRWPRASTTTWELARMNLAFRGIDANLGPRNADSFRADLKGLGHGL